jgi:hypothetical protein
MSGSLSRRLYKAKRNYLTSSERSSHQIRSPLNLLIFEVFKITEKNALKDEKSKTIYVRSIFNGQSIEIEGCYNTFN